MAAHISWVLLPEVWLRNVFTETLSKEQHLLPARCGGTPCDMWAGEWAALGPRSRARITGAGEWGLGTYPASAPADQGILPMDAHHPPPGRDPYSQHARGTGQDDSRRGPRTAWRPPRSRPPSRVPSPLLTSRVWAARRDEAPRRALRRAGLRVQGGGRGSPHLGRPPFYPPVSSPAHRPAPEEAGPGRPGPRGAGSKDPGRGMENESRGNARAVTVMWHRGRATRRVSDAAASQ